jgi:CO dehydrogenase/acetyl-CoA synthase alpha subunit
MPASIDAVQAILSRIRERNHVTRADIEVLVDAVIEQRTAQFVRDAQRAGHTAAEIETVLETNRATLREWRRDTLRDTLDESFGTKANAPTAHTRWQ